MAEDHERGVDAFEIDPAAEAAIVPAQRGRFRWWMVIPVALVLLLGVCGSIALKAKGEIDGARLATTAYFTAVRAGDWETASSLRCESTAAEERDAVQAFEQTYDGAIGPVRFGAFNVQSSAGADTTAVLGGTVAVGARRLPLEIELEKRAGAWKLCTIEVDPGPTSTTERRLR